MIKAFVFDMGGTLEDICHESVQNRRTGERLLAYLRAHGMELDIDAEEFTLTLEENSRKYRAWSMDSLRELSPAEIWENWYLKGFLLNAPRLQVIANNLANIWERNYYTRALRPEAPALLHSLKHKGYRLGVISNTGCQTQVIEILHEYGIHQYFDTIYLSSIAGFRKPRVELFHAAAADLGVKPEECVYVGDTVSRDVRGSRAAGYGACVRIDSHLTGSSDALYVKGEEEANYLVKNLLEIVSLFPDIATH